MPSVFAPLTRLLANRTLLASDALSALENGVLKVDAVTVTVPEGKRGPHGGTIQVVGQDPIELGGVTVNGAWLRELYEGLLARYTVTIETPAQDAKRARTTRAGGGAR
jgi:hypothetical protein